MEPGVYQLTCSIYLVLVSLSCYSRYLRLSVHQLYPCEIHDGTSFGLEGALYELHSWAAILLNGEYFCRGILIPHRIDCAFMVVQNRVVYKIQ